MILSQKIFKKTGAFIPSSIRAYAKPSSLSKETLLIGGKTMNPIHVFVVKHKIPLMAAGGVSIIFAVFGFKTPLVFVGQCIGKPCFIQIGLLESHIFSCCCRFWSCGSYYISS